MLGCSLVSKSFRSTLMRSIFSASSTDSAQSAGSMEAKPRSPPMGCLVTTRGRSPSCTRRAYSFTSIAKTSASSMRPPTKTRGTWKRCSFSLG